ncbi:response regulator transcription factor NblR [Acaryochloris marina]|uniref:Two-component transcriptional regulator n=1 Tax=Acaryochloris marina (strain MBIC 11017) TaxID=329726 RepID=B0CFF1_ACAM1|nr:response regulator transcription factor [Acaryochloris marina]ABW25838.1 two-component transcriptional regulator [Acaryochloris marina MBIC11017]BDM80703.1 DNA-binding response regulator [Acaryochloris marina MBIC10699]
MSDLSQVMPGNLPHVLLVIDQPQLSRRLRDTFLAQGFYVTVVGDAEDAIAHCKTQPPALAMIDQQISEQSGVQLCRQLRAEGVSIPLLLLMEKDSREDRIVCLEAGADDYILSPHAGEVLLQRVRQYFKSDSGLPSKVLSFQDLQLDLATRRAQRRSRTIELTMKEFELLRYLMEHPREILTREQILENVWGFDFRGESNVIEVYIRYLRLKVQVAPEKRLIHTVRGVGYVLREA